MKGVRKNLGGCGVVFCTSTIFFFKMYLIKYMLIYIYN